MALIPIFLLVLIIIAAFVTSIVASLYAYLYLRKSNELNKSKSFDSETIKFVQDELKKTVTETLSEIEPKVFADKKLNDLIHEKIDEILLSVKNETLDRLKSEAGDFHNEYSEAISQMKQLHTQSAIESVSQVEQILKTELDDLKKQLQNETVASQKIIGERLERAFEQANQEIDEYKKQRLEIFGKELGERANSILKEILAENLDSKAHEKLIKDAMDKASKSSFFK